MQADLFAHKSKNWDMSSRRVRNAQSIADAIAKRIALDDKMRLLDVGAGTGLLSYFLSKYVAHITALDTSASMLEVFREKQAEFQCETTLLHGDIMQLTQSHRFEGIVSSMTIHHIEDIPQLFSKLYRLLNPGGFIALADLDAEDGSFHSDNTGVYHYGFDRKHLRQIAHHAGFETIAFDTPNVIEKPHRDFPVFLLTAYKKEN